ncbi:MAG: hypothetical protein U5L45_21040 [Saprospiraceae bacterium]|nr:hypothetical protein [Saprospiraceae bacterium]
MDSSFLTYSWKKTEGAATADKIMNFGAAKTYSVADFDAWLDENANRRINYALQFNNNATAVAEQCYKDFVTEKALSYEETQLDKKYPDFKNLMREYEEGILLFEAIKQNVWDKASVDTIGLEKFFKNNRDKFRWEERGSFINYSVSDTLKSEIDAIKKYAEKNEPKKVLDKFNKKRRIRPLLRRNQRPQQSQIGSGCAVGKKERFSHNNNSPLNFAKIEKIIAAGPKELKEARGFAVADYQEFLEKQWVVDLAKAYPVQIDQKVLDSIVK